MYSGTDNSSINFIDLYKNCNSIRYLHFSAIRISLLFILALILLAPMQHSVADTHIKGLEVYYNEVLRTRMADKRSWLSLGHYRINSFTYQYYSEIDGEDFFLADAGSYIPRDELLASVEAMHLEVKKDPNLHPQCLFPARLSFLKKNLANFNSKLPIVKCQKYLEWRHYLNAESLSLVFTSPNVGNTGSIFGNTFLKVNPPKLRSNVFNKDNDNLPAKAISYALDATEQEQDEWFHSVKVAFGQYPGKITVEDYDTRIARYKNIENRDLWEYQLNLTPLETEKVLEHVWELINTNIDYYYIDENSAYLILSLIETVIPEINLSKIFAVQVLPVDTIRELIDKEIVSDIKYVPSTLSNLVYHFNSYSNSEQDMMIALIDGDLSPNDQEFKKLPSTVQIFLIEVVGQYLQLAFKRGNIDRISYKLRSTRLSDARKKLDPDIKLANSPPPFIRPDQGHMTSHISFGVGQNDIQNFVELNWRPALHGLLDSDGSYASGIQISYFDTALRIDEDNGFVQIDRLKLIDLYSLRPRNKLFKPWSVKFNAGIERSSVFSESEENLHFNVNAGFGLTYEVAKPTLVYGMVEASMLVDKRFDNKVSFGLGYNFGVLWQINNAWKTWLDSSTLYYDDQNNNNIIENHSLNQSYAINKNRVLSLAYSKQGLQDFAKEEVKLSLTWFY